MLQIEDVTTWQILIVDDEPDNVEVVAKSLQYFGANIAIALDGKQAIEKLKDFSANLILMDLSMPVMDGWQARSAIKTQVEWEHLPIIALSAHALVGDSERAISAGFNGYMTKPVNIRTIVADIQTHLRKYIPTDD